jgi:D-arabinose 1-dehydrogenase-like Zn-dependent alcohol dehydrogenase
VTLPGGFAEFFKAPARNVLLLPDSVSFESGGLVSCGVITAVHAYRRSRLLAHDSAVVIGAGGIGLMLVQLLANAGLRVVALSRSPQNLDLARREGAALALSLLASESTERIRAFADGEGADCVFDCVGTAATMEIAAAVARRGGRIVVIGEEPEFPRIDTIQIAQRELEIIGSRNGSIHDAMDAIRLLEAGIIRPPIAGRFPLEGLNAALEQMRVGGVQGRLLIQMPSS